MLHRISRHYRASLFLVFIFSFMLGSLVTSAQTGDTPTLPESTAEASDVQPTVIPTAEIVPSPTVWVEPTPDATPTAAPTVETPVSDTLLDTTPEVTVEVTVEADADRRPPPTGSGDPSDRLRRPQTYCEMSITDANDTNPFTFAFSAVNANNIASYAWTLGDGVGTSTAASFNYTYAGPGDYTITLICTPQPDSGAPITLEGQISITPTTLADFVLLPGQIFEDLPVTVTAQNTSIGDNLTYEWWINRSLDPNAGPFIYGSNASPITTEDISFEFTSAQVTAFPAEFYFHMRATAPGGIQSARSQSIVFNIASPNADFTLSPVSGPAPLTVTVTGVDLLAGPIDEWFWDLNGDFDPVARTGAEASGIGPHSFVFSTPDSLNTVTLHYRGPGLPANLFNSVTKSAYAADPGGPLFAAFSAELTGVVSGGLVQVCFTNESEGPIDFVEWDFNNDGTVELNSETDPTALNEVVCWFFAEQSEPYTVELTVGRLPRVPVIISQATRNVVVTAPPVASFNVSPGEQIEWGTRLNLTNTSTGVITSYAWDLDNDGQFDDSTAQNPSNLALSTIGANVITLKVTGPGGSSTAQKTIIVGVKPVTCDISGTFKVLPGAASQSYTATVNGLNVSGFPTRTITYTWQVLGTGNLPPVTTGSSINIDWASVGFGNYTLLLSGVTSDGAPCNATATVNHSYEPLVCNTNVSPSFSGYPDGRTYTLTASVSGLNGRAAPTAYRWYVNGVLDPAQTGATYSFTNTDDTTAVPTTFNIRYETDVNNDRPGVDYTPDTSSCDDTTTLNVGQWPDLSCNSIDGNATPLPITPDNPTRTYTYTAQLGNLAGRTNLSYAWTIPNTVSQSQSGNNVTVSWSNAAASLAPGSSNDNLAVLVTVTNPDGTTDTCSINRNVNVRVPRLTCSISGDLFTVIGENEIYNSTRGNVYGRTISHAWTLTPVSPAGAPITGTGSTFNYTFLNADTLYTLSYTATAAADPVTGLVGDTCTSSPLNISTYGEGVNWSCESALTGSATPNNPASTYSYNLTVDNGNVPAVNLTYTYTLYDYLNNAYPLGSITRTTNGVVTSPAFTLAQLGPLGVDNYRLEVDVTDDDPATDLTCNRSLNLTVGTLTADFSYTAGIYTNSAVAINQAICLTNTTSAVPGDIDTPNYTWEILGVSGSNPAQTTLGPTTTFSGRDLTCFAFTQTGSYDVRLTAVTDSGLRTSTDTLRFNVYGLQGIQINRSGSSFGGTNQTLSAIGTNLFSGQYQWRIYTPASAGTPSYTSSQQNYTVNLPAGEYRAVVTGNGNLGQTSAEITFTLLPTDGLSARFVANRYAGPSGTEFCFTDRSVSGSPISLWEWDVDGDGAFEITSSTGSPNPCITLTGGGVSRAIRLRVTNSTFTDVATNIVRTYTLEESRNTFTITPQGNGAYCFNAVLVDGVSVTSWDFGDGTQMSTPALPGGTLNEVCHTYNVTGEFRVIMRITPPDGEIEKPVYPQIGATPPNLAVNVVCTGANNATPVFRITNTGGPLQSAIVYRYFDGNGNQIGNSGTFTLAGGTPSVPEVLTFTGPAYVGGLRFVTEGLAEAGTNLTAEIDLSSPCTVPPELTSSATCDAVTFLPSFTVTNEAPANGPMPDAYRWEIRDSSSILIASGTFQLDGDFDSVTASVPAGNNPYDTYTFTVYDENDVVVSALGQTRNCAPPPSLSISSTCAYPVAFTVSNSGGAMVMGQQYTVYDSVNGIVQTGTLPAIAANSTATVELTGLDPYVYYRIETTGTGFLTGVSDESNCARPAFTVEQVCGFPLTFTVTNTGGQMLTTADYTITNTPESTQAQTGTLSGLAPNAQTTLTLTTSDDPYDSYTVAINGGFVTVNTTSPTPCARPVFTVEQVCGFPLTFTVTNTGGQMLTTANYTITNTTESTQAQTGTLSGLAPNGQTTLTLTASDDPYDSYTVAINGGFVTVNTTSPTPCPRPVFTVEQVCGFPLTFTVTNTGGQMLTTADYTITNTTESTQAQTGTLSGLAPNAQTTLTLTASDDPYDSYTVAINGGFVTVNTTSPTPCARPAFTVEQVCGFPLTFTVTNTGGQMLTTANYTITNTTESTQAQTGTLSGLAPNAQTTLTLTTSDDPYDSYTVAINGGFVTVNTTSPTPCARPVFTVEQVCGFPLTFTVTNTGGQMLTTASYTITNTTESTQAQTGTLSGLAPNAQTTLTLTTSDDPYDSYTVAINGGFVTVNTTSPTPCARPVFTVEQVCGFPLTFTVTNTGGQMLTTADYTITNTTESTQAQTGTLSGLAPNAQTTLTLTTSDDPYDSYTVAINGGFVTVNTTSPTPCARPVFTVEQVCGFPLTFTVTNTGGQMLTTADYTITNTTESTQAQTGTLSGLAPNAQTTLTLTTSDDPYDSYTVAINGGFVTVNTTSPTPCPRPGYTLQQHCEYPLRYVVTNSSGDMLTGATYFVTNNTTGQQVATGPVNNLANGDQLTITLTPDDNPYHQYTVEVSSGFVTLLNESPTPCTRPALDIMANCAYPMVFTITNRGGDMLRPETYTVNAGPLTWTGGTLPVLLAGEVFEVELGPDANIYDPFTLDVTGMAGDFRGAQDCANPTLVINAVCGSPVAFTVTNTGGPLFTPDAYTVTRGGEVVASGQLTPMAGGASQQVTLDAALDPYGEYTLTTGGMAGGFSGMRDCVKPIVSARLPGNTSGAPGASTGGAAPVCGRTCPTFRLYHTDETGDWEIFRLDGADAVNEVTFRQNLSFGVGEGVVDLAPSLSPNQEWIAFSSNRDGNWEIYVASTSGSAASVQRVTFNTVAIDTDPVWGPNNIVVFETSRNGNWDLYAADMETGRVYPLTVDASDEINAFWSDDGARLLFQSDRPDENGVQKWQIYELTLATGAVRKLSDGTTIDVDPQYANNSTGLIAFRSYTDDGANSVLNLMNGDGTNRRAISTPDGDATNAAWSPQNRYIAYQSDLDGDLDIYVYEVATGLTRQLTGNDIPDYAPTWTCSDERVVFTSDISGHADIYEADVQPISGEPIAVDVDADRLTFETASDVYPLGQPSEENASREGQTALGSFGQQTIFLQPPANATLPDLSRDGDERDDWNSINVCPAPDA